MPQDQHVGVSPGIAKSLAEALSVPLQLVPFPGPGIYWSVCGFLERENVNYDHEKMPLRKWALQLFPFLFSSGKLADAIVDDVWDVANIACEQVPL